MDFILFSNVSVAKKEPSFQILTSGFYYEIYKPKIM